MKIIERILDYIIQRIKQGNKNFDNDEALNKAVEEYEGKGFKVMYNAR